MWEAVCAGTLQSPNINEKIKMDTINSARTIYRRKFLGVVGALAGTLGISPDAAAAPPAMKQERKSGNVKEFGATGDGKTDDTVAIQRAIDAGDGYVYFPKGEYRITRTLVVELARTGFTSLKGDGSAEIVMEGAGPAIKLVGTHFKSADPWNFADEVWKKERMPMVDNLAITGAHPEAVGVEAVGTMQMTLTRLFIRNVLHAIHLTGNNRNIVISACHLYQNRGVGVYYDDVNLHQSNIVGCHISYNDGGGIVSRGGNVRNIQITGCDIESNMGKDVSSGANVLIDCSTSAVGTAEVAITGCSIQHNNESPDSANIRIFGRGKPGPSPIPEPWGNVTITGNILSDVMVNLHLRECRGVAVSGNTFWSGFRYNLLMEGCRSVVFGSNVFDFNVNYTDRTEAGNAVVVKGCEDCTITGLHITNAPGTTPVVVEDCRRMNISACTILDSGEVGLVLKKVSKSIVSGCLIRNDLRPSGFMPLKTIECSGNLITNNVA